MVESSKIKRIREKLGLSQEKLARLADVSNNTIINIEAGKQQKPTVDTIKKIAKGCFENVTKTEQSEYLLSASFAVNFLMDIEPRLSNDIGKNDILQLEILSDHHGKPVNFAKHIAQKIMTDLFLTRKSEATQLLS